MTRQTLVEAYQAVEKEGFVELGEGLSLQTFKSIKNEDWFGGESDNLDWSGCEDDYIFLMTDTGDAIRIDSIEELLDEVEHEAETQNFFVIESEEVRYTSKYGRLDRDFSGDSWNETAETLEDAIGAMYYYWRYLTEAEKAKRWITVTEYEGDPEDVNTWDCIKNHCFVSKVEGIEFFSESYKDDLYIASQIADGRLDKANVQKTEFGYLYKESDFEFEVKTYDFEEWGDIEVNGVVTIF